MPLLANQVPWPHYVVNAYLLTLFVGFIVTAVVVIVRLAKRQPLIAAEPRRDVPWNGILPGLIMALAAFLTLTFIGQLLIGEVPIENQEAKPISHAISESAIWVNLVNSIVIALILGTILALAFGARAYDFGVSAKHFLSDIKLGIGAFVFMAPLIYGLQLGLKLIFSESDDHPMIESLRESDSISLFAASFVAAVIVAPLVEEFIFRNILQGWLERFFCGNAATPESIAELPLSDLAVDQDAKQSPSTVEHLLPNTEGVTEVISDPMNPYASPLVDPTLEPQSSPKADQRPLYIPSSKTYLPIVISAVIFALVHLGSGVAPIPLFFFALGLGFLYLRTHRIVPCIVVHVLLNFTTMVILWVNVWYPIDLNG